MIMTHENKVKTGRDTSFTKIEKEQRNQRRVFDAARLVYRITREKLAKGKSERPPGDLPVGREYRPSCDNDLGERVSRLFVRFAKRAVKKGNHPDTTDREKKRCLRHNCITCLREEQFVSSLFISVYFTVCVSCWFRNEWLIYLKLDIILCRNNFSNIVYICIFAFWIIFYHCKI